MLRHQARLDTRGKGVVNRRSFLKGLSVAGATSAVLPTGTLFLADGKTQAEEGSGNLNAGDAAMLRFAAEASSDRYYSLRCRVI
jgi:TAT (twin-arginine translocation) pathway signal sequence